jgi:hypothetical protein
MLISSAIPWINTLRGLAATVWIGILGLCFLISLIYCFAQYGHVVRSKQLGDERIVPRGILYVCLFFLVLVHLFKNH